MLKKIGLVLGGLFASGCASLMNSGRPKYRGPVVPPVWHNADVRVSDAPLISGGTVYAIARSWNEERPRLCAFDLKAGKQLWAADFSPDRLLAATENWILARDRAGGAWAYDSKTGQKSSLVVAGPVESAIVANHVLYVAGQRGEIRALDESAHPLWKTSVPAQTLAAPVFAGGSLYIRGFTHVDLLTKDLNGVYALDATTGALRWKFEVQDHFHSFGDMTADADHVFIWEHDTSQSTFGNGVLIALDAAGGKQKWSQTALMYTDSPALAGDDVVVMCDYPPDKNTADDAGYMYRGLKRATGEKVWEAKTSWKYNAPRFQQGDLLYVADVKVHEVLTENNNNSPDSWVAAVDLRTGKEFWRSEVIELGALTPPAVGEGMVVVGSTPFTWTSPARAGKREVSGLWAWRAR
ncbi:MAG TPA: PQQ-binding-like beta-propeller repeat protein [Bryobacteraceae bacterium]|nr:PQQ-binding-like beta-propeller repeat protein [Bryobacteraceae bacterium]